MLFHRSDTAVSLPRRVRIVLLASIAALVLTTFGAQAAPVARASAAPGQELAAAGEADFGSRRRARARRSNAAGLAMMGMMVGTIGAVIAAQQRRDAYRRVYHDYPYGYAQPYVYRQPYAYGGPRVRRGPRVYRQPNVYRNANPTWHDRRQYINPQNPNAANPTGVPRIGW